MNRELRVVGHRTLIYCWSPLRLVYRLVKSGGAFPLTEVEFLLMGKVFPRQVLVSLTGEPLGGVVRIVA